MITTIHVAAAGCRLLYKFKLLPLSAKRAVWFRHQPRLRGGVHGQQGNIVGPLLSASLRVLPTWRLLVQTLKPAPCRPSSAAGAGLLYNWYDHTHLPLWQLKVE